jgi:hypothetical protein
MHCMISVLVIVQLVTYHLESVDIFPEPQKWEYIWILSLIASVIGYFSLAKNRITLIKVYYYGNLIFGLFPIISTIIFNATDFLKYTQNKDSTKFFNGFPLIVLWYIFLFVSLQVHILGVYNARVLIKAWKDSGKKRK